jgi:hypothetical protein
MTANPHIASLAAGWHRKNLRACIGIFRAPFAIFHCQHTALTSDFVVAAPAMKK